MIYAPKIENYHFLTYLGGKNPLYILDISLFLRTFQHYYVLFMSYDDGWNLFSYQYKEETHSYIGKK